MCEEMTLSQESQNLKEGIKTWFQKNQKFFTLAQETLTQGELDKMGLNEAHEIKVLIVNPRSPSFDPQMLLSGTETLDEDLVPQSDKYIVYFFQKSQRQLRLFKRFKCLHKLAESGDECGQVIPSLTKLVEHQRFHAGYRPYSCSFCELKFTQKGNLDTHIKTVHFLTQRIECEHCGKFYLNKSNLKAHVKREKNKSKYPRSFQALD